MPPSEDILTAKSRLSKGTDGMLHLQGGSALSAFRLKKLTETLRKLVPAIVSIHTSFYHFLVLHRSLTQDQQSILEQLLCYGAAFLGDERQRPGMSTQQLLVVPRLGTISPWSSKATNIAHNCGLEAVRRIERGVTYDIACNDNTSLSDEDLTALLPHIHDRMNQIVLSSFDEANSLFYQA